jgi:hypothetical protein
MTDSARRSSHRHTRRGLWLCGFAAAAWASAGTLPGPQSTVAAPATCDQTPLRSIPPRTQGAPTGSEFVQRIRAVSGLARDELVQSELLSGNIPHFLRRLTPVTISGVEQGQPVEITVCVLPDYLAVGSDRDFVYVPMGLEAALEIGVHFGFGLPTPTLVDAIYEESRVKLDPLPLPAGDSMRSTDYFAYHSELIARQRRTLSAGLGELTAGHKKDLVLTNRLWHVPDRVAIYGWHRDVDRPIQPLSTVHGARYADYSHGVRLVSDTVYINGRKRPIDEVLGEPALAHLLTVEGPMARLSERLTALIAHLAKGTEATAWLRPSYPVGSQR